MKNQVFVYITGNKITNKKAIAKAFNELKDGRYLITIEGHKNRSTQQNKYYHGCVLPLVKDGLRDIGYAEIKENEDAHEVLKYLFLKRSIPNEGTGEAIEVLGSTTNLSTVEFNLFIDPSESLFDDDVNSLKADINALRAEVIKYLFKHKYQPEIKIEEEEKNEDSDIKDAEFED